MSGPIELPEVGPWAKDKLERLRKYLAAYTTVLSKQLWAKGFVYVDAFAGGGRAVVRQQRPAAVLGPKLDLGEDLREDAETQQVVDGSPRVALDIEPPFTSYVFVEQEPERLSMLRELEAEYKGKRRVLIREGDCNEYLDKKLIHNPNVDWKKWRAVVFLDPFGMQVPWVTLAGLAGTKAIEVFLNLPVGMAIQRLLKRSGKFSQKERAKLDGYFGSSQWFDIAYPESTGLFGPLQSKAGDAGDRLVEWYRERLRSAFGYVSSAYLVRNSRGGHLYYLIHAGPNRTGAKIADFILQGGTKVGSVSPARATRRTRR